MLSFSPSHPVRSHNLDGSHTLAGMLLAAVMAALLVAADQVIDTWADGHLLAGWVALWTVAFAALALLAPPLRQVSSYCAAAYSRWVRASALRRQEETLWEHARRDPRIMAELRVAAGIAGEFPGQQAQAASSCSNLALVSVSSLGKW